MRAARVTAVKKISGEASIAVVRGTRRHMYDYAATLEWEATLGDAARAPGDDAGARPPSAQFKGTIKLPEISSTCR